MIKEKFYQFVIRDKNGKVFDIESFRDTDQASARLQAIVKAQRHEYYYPELSPMKVTAYRN